MDLDSRLPHSFEHSPEEAAVNAAMKSFEIVCELGFENDSHPAISRLISSKKVTKFVERFLEEKMATIPLSFTNLILLIRPYGSGSR